MPALQVKDCPDDVYEGLRVCASEELRSLSQQTVFILREYLLNLKSAQIAGGRPARSSGLRSWEEVEDDAARRLKRRRATIERIKNREMPDVPEGFPSPEDIVRAMRDERSLELFELCEHPQPTDLECDGQ